MLESLRGNKFTYKKLSLQEQQQRGILGRLTGIIADTTAPTRNGRTYGRDLWENVFNNDIMQEKIANHLVMGELGHPADREEIDLEKVAVCLAEQPKFGNDGKIYGVFDILNTPNGRLLKSLCDYGCTVGVSSRGTGDLITDYDGNEIVDPETYNCECWDVVVVPAVKEARMKYVTESLSRKKHNKTLKQTLVESYNRASDDDKKVMKESLNNIGIKLDENDNFADNDLKEEFCIVLLDKDSSTLYFLTMAGLKDYAKMVLDTEVNNNGELIDVDKYNEYVSKMDSCNSPDQLCNVITKAFDSILSYDMSGLIVGPFVINKENESNIDDCMLSSSANFYKLDNKDISKEEAINMLNSKLPNAGVLGESKMIKESKGLESDLGLGQMNTAEEDKKELEGEKHKMDLSALPKVNEACEDGNCEEEKVEEACGDKPIDESDEEEGYNVSDKLRSFLNNIKKKDESLAIQSGDVPSIPAEKRKEDESLSESTTLPADLGLGQMNTAEEDKETLEGEKHKMDLSALPKVNEAFDEDGDIDPDDYNDDFINTEENVYNNTEEDVPEFDDDSVADINIEDPIEGEEALSTLQELEPGEPVVIVMAEGENPQQVLFAGVENIQGEDSYTFFTGEGFGNAFSVAESYITGDYGFMLQVGISDQEKVDELDQEFNKREEEIPSEDYEQVEYEEPVEEAPVDESVKKDELKESLNKTNGVGTTKPEDIKARARKRIASLKKHNEALTEKLSVSIAKEKKLEEELAKYKAMNSRLSDKAREAKDLRESLTKAEDELKSVKQNQQRLTESANGRQVKTEGEVKELKAKISAQDKKLSRAEQLAESYKSNYNTVKNELIKTKAEQYGVDPDAVVAQLGKSYKMSDIDRVCESLAMVNRNMSKLPINLTEGARLTRNMKIKTYEKQPDLSDDDYIDPELLKDLF